MSELILVPTPISDDLPLEEVALKRLKEDALKEDVVLLVEEHKVARQRWLKWGLPREAIEKFQLYNEHTSTNMKNEVMRELLSGKRVYLMSDCGLPAFCDPGQNLVDLCHKKKIKVTSTPFPNSIALAVALSGFSHTRFTFSGFIPVKEPQRSEWMKAELKRPETLIWMETPYRLHKLLEEMQKTGSKREVFLGMDLGSPTERLIRGNVAALLKEVAVGEKREFVLVVSQIS
ncbi:MAG: SAM-dependent methyltransferase [Bacteriovoracia bacterium]